MTGEFDLLYRGGTATLERADGRAHPLRGDRWSAEPDEADRCLLSACRGPVLDVGCGPGRLTAELAARGVPVLGIDTSPLAVRLTTARRAPALRRDVFGRLPAEGRWREVLLIDGNIGIGGDPEALLRRVRALLRCGGAAVVEVEAPGTGLWRGTGRVVRAGRGTGPFRWAVVGAEAIDPLARIAGFARPRIAERSGRWFAWLNVT
ncbi:class I SAM-dependent methyltransferase [Saccharopolyspora griseoalba]|uniref:Class I SAM-dependent methyltransferase n=1 Tax=Saccharopolyspora griseoalba TaxID=1431848 RepID=A0ABW2LG32_9PSEU